MSSKQPSILFLASSASPALDFSDDSLRLQLVAGLRGSDKLVVPGGRPEDRAYAYKRSVPTILLYDEQGLLNYDEITQGDFYYPFNAELEILQSNGDDIARRMFGLPTAPRAPKIKERWGDDGPGVHNKGVNGQFAVPTRGTVVELGAGSLRKTSHLLSAIGRLNHSPAPASSTPPITYHALDLDRSELERTLGELEGASSKLGLAGKVAVGGLEGTYDMGFEWLRSGGPSASSSATSSSSSPELGPTQLDNSTPLPTPPTSPGESNAHLPSTNGKAEQKPEKKDGNDRLCILHLGSSLGNFTRDEAVEFLRSIADVLRPGKDTLLLGLDSRNEKALVERAYNDEGGVTRKFIMHGLERGGKILAGSSGNVTLRAKNFDYVARYNEVEGRHEAYYRSKRRQSIALPDPAAKGTSNVDVSTPPEIIELEEGELLNVEWSYKYSDPEVTALLSASGLRPIQSWKDSHGRYGLWLVERPAFTFAGPNLPAWAKKGGERGQGVPSVREWEDMWKCWDGIRGMVPREMMHQKPIDLRHIVLFYLGHIPAFLDIYLSRFFNEPHIPPEFYKDIFERGIDPSMDDPTRCHAHSIVPESEADWPALEDVLDFDLRVRERVLRVYEDVRAGRRTMDRKLGRVLFMTFEHMVMHGETLLYMLLQRAGTGTLPPQGFTPPDWASLSRAWDAHAAREACGQVLSFSKQRIVLGHHDREADDVRAGKKVEGTESWEHEYGWDCEHPAREVEVDAFRVRSLPISNGEFRKYLKEVGSDYVPPSWVVKDGETKVRTFYGPVDFSVAQHWPCIAPATHLARYASHVGGRLPTEPELRVLMCDPAHGVSWDHAGANVGFRHWHPVPAESARVESDGTVVKGHNGGVWEWTSTNFAEVEGYEASELYPGYSSDFFDGAHAVVIGASFATLPRIAGRWSFRNWYQHGYGYCWAGARVAYDA